MPMSVTYTNFGGQLVHENRGGVETFFTSDPEGSIVECRDSTGVLTFSATYWPYGELRTTTGTNPSQFDFIGSLGYYRENSARAYVRARFLRKELGRWMTVDAYWPTEPAFNYVRNRPTSDVDPSGNQGVWQARPPRKLPLNTGQDCGDGPGWACLNIVCLTCLKGVFDRGILWVDERERRKPPMPGSWYNAMRHCISSCLAAQECGCECAHIADYREWDPDPTYDNKCDLHNNRYGRFLGGSFAGNCPDMCALALKEGNLCFVLGLRV